MSSAPGQLTALADNEGYDAFVPLIDSGIYIAAWVKPRFLSTILYTCGEFDENRAVAPVRDFFKLPEQQAAIFQARARDA